MRRGPTGWHALPPPVAPSASRSGLPTAHRRSMRALRGNKANWRLAPPFATMAAIAGPATPTWTRLTEEALGVPT